MGMGPAGGTAGVSVSLVLREAWRRNRPGPTSPSTCVERAEQALFTIPDDPAPAASSTPLTSARSCPSGYRRAVARSMDQRLVGTG
jgi:hypothetical protein